MKMTWRTWAFHPARMKQGSSPIPHRCMARWPIPADRRQVVGEGGARELAPEVRVPIWGKGGGGAHHGGLAAVKQIGGGESATAGRRRGGERRLRVRGAVVSSGGGHCSDGGARRWPDLALDGKAASATEGGSMLGASTVSYDGRWLRGTQELCGVVSASALGAKECGDEGAEADGESRAEWAGVQRLSWEEERRLLLWTDSATR
jgi:hypothetical protein